MAPILNMSLQMELSNFTLMTICVCGIVTFSVYFAEEYIRKPSKTSNKITENIIRLPDILHTGAATLKSDTLSQNHDSLLRINTTTTTRTKSFVTDKSYTIFLLYNLLYFLTMFVTVVVMRSYPLLLLCIQHIAIVLVVGFYFLQFSRASIAVPLTAVYMIVWFCSLHTSYRWLINNTIVIMCVLLTGYVQFRNFIYLQTFMWLAFFYDVYMLGGVNISDTPHFFSFGDKSIPHEINQVVEATSEACQNLLCSIFTHDKGFKLPTVFSIQFGSPIDYVYIGSGDIMIGALVANFSLTFFKKIKYVLFTVLCFGVSVAMLSQVNRTPFPALLSIVPILSIALMVSALFSRRALEMFLDRDYSRNEVDKMNSVNYLDV